MVHNFIGELPGAVLKANGVHGVCEQVTGMAAAAGLAGGIVMFLDEAVEQGGVNVSAK